MEREYTRARLAEKTSLNETDNDEDEEAEEEEDDEGGEVEAEEDEEEETEELPRFDDQRYPQASQPSAGAQQFDPERMLGYSRTDEDLPILDMENEVLQRTLKDYNAYMSSSAAGTAKTSRNKVSLTLKFIPLLE